MKKLLSIFLTIALVFSFATMGVSAAQQGQTGTIYINNIHSETEYKVYKLFDLATMASDGSSYSYKIEEKIEGVDNPWYTFFKSSKATPYFIIDVNGAVTKTDAYTEATAIDFAKEALKYAKDNNITPEADTPTINGSIGKFENLELGYYLVDSSVGALCGLTTTKPTASITVKNLAPTVDKNVQEDSVAGSGTNSWGKANTADIGQEIKFDVSIFAQAGAENYVYHDKMENMIFMEDKSFEVIHHKVNENEKITLDSDDYTFSKMCSDGCSFEVVFTQAFCDTIKANDKIYITYSGKLNESATIGGNGNKNTGWLTYGDANNGVPLHKTEDTITTTYTYGFDIVKTDHNYNKLVGAKFKLYTKASDNTKTYLSLAYNPITNVYRAYNQKMDNEEIRNEIEVLENSQTYAHNFTIARIVGLDNGTYYLEESVAPQGYNKLTTDREFTISGSEIYATFTNTIDGSASVYTYDKGSGIHIENKAGATMPETGGMGTTLFVSLGAIVVLGTGVLLVTKKRMSMIDD